MFLSGSTDKARERIQTVLFCCNLLLFSPPLLTHQEDAASKAGEPGQSEEAVEDIEDKAGILDRHKEYMDSRVLRASSSVDSFFADENYDAESAYSQLRVRPELYYRDQQGLKVKGKVLIKLRLPNISRKLSLVVGSNELEEDFGDTLDDSANDTIAGLQFFLGRSEKWNTSISAGVKFNEFAFYAGPRIRYRDSITEKTSYRFTQSVRWQTNNRWNTSTRLDLNHVFNDNFFFRQTVDARWRGERSDEEGLRTRVSSIVSQRLGDRTGLQYEFTTIFHTKPDSHVDKYVASVRFRKRTNREWLYYEVVPLIAFEDEFDFKANPGIRLRLEFFYGGTQIWRHDPEDSDDFSW